MVCSCHSTRTAITSHYSPTFPVYTPVMSVRRARKLYMLGVSSTLWSTPKGGSGEVVKRRSTDECHCIETMGDLITQEDVEDLIS